ncbi:MAG: hypothetical protein KJ667_07840, partial [Alphaproteobacteria bacterium]|nr:hypothetical protein [Alphaproteobacteria bacterium]
MARLAEQQAEKARAPASSSAASSSRTAASFSPATLPGLGKAQSPAEGIITVGYGQKDEIGANSEGITIESAPRRHRGRAHGGRGQVFRPVQELR